jgi:PhzF family phenazine biosynthesis protein
MNQLYKLSAFPKNDKGGNKAGVYLFADELSENEMQDIAKEVGFSETAFVSKSIKADFKVRFFSPSEEVDLCGHATIATFSLLRDLNYVGLGTYTQETKVGVLSIKVEKNYVFMQQKKPYFGKTIHNNNIKTCFNNIDFDHRFTPQIVSTGLKEIFVGVKNLEVLNNLKPNLNTIEELLIQTDTVGMHVFCLDHEVDAYGRNFIPIFGIEEESATGTSNGALSCYLYQHHHKKNAFTLRQGYAMNQPSEIKTSLIIQNQKIVDVWVGGTAIIINSK